MTEVGFKEAFYVYSFIVFIVGILFRYATKDQFEKPYFGVRIIWLIIPTFFVGFYLSDFLMKDWSGKSDL